MPNRPIKDPVTWLYPAIEQSSIGARLPKRKRSLEMKRVPR